MPNDNRRFVLLDRDGVLNAAPNNRYVTSAVELVLLPGAAEAVRKFNDNDFGVLVVSNQQCVGKGLLTAKELNELSTHLAALIRDSSGGEILHFFYCPHLVEDNCDCRKPKPGLILQAREKYGFDPGETYLIGDSYKDLETARTARCPSILVLSGNDTARYQAGDPPPGPPAHVAENLLRAVDHIVGDLRD